MPIIVILNPTAIKTAAYTAATGELVLCDTSAGGFDVTLPSIAAGEKRQLVVKIVAGSNAVGLVPNGTDEVEATSFSGVGAVAWLFADSTATPDKWRVLSGEGTINDAAMNTFAYQNFGGL